jgi:hypothetical protein
MNSELSNHLRDMASRTFRYGETDCAMFAAIWVRKASGVDVTGGLRATDEAHAAQITGGDLLAFTRGMMEAAGFAETDSPMRGDVGVILHDGQPRCAIKLAEGWAVKSADGVSRGLAEMLVAWSIPIREGV